MNREIGSFYESDPQQNYANGKRTLFDLLENYADLRTAYFSSGREAIEAVVESIEMKKTCAQRCLLPSYTCDTVIIPFVKHGWDVHFYDIQKNLQINSDTICTQYEQYHPSVILVHTYYGIDTACNIREQIQQWQKENGLIYIEDMTQSLFLLPELAPTADYYVGSLRKWFAMPDGAFALSREALSIQDKGENRIFVDLKMEAQQMKYEYLNGEREDKKECLDKNRQAEDYLYSMESYYTMSQAAVSYLQNHDIDRIGRRRNENAEVLIRAIDSLKVIDNMIHVQQEAPLYVPIYTADRDTLQRYLIGQDIFAPVLWPVPEECEPILSEETRYIYDNMLGLPCDQRYDAEDMKRIADCLKNYDDMVSNKTVE